MSKPKPQDLLLRHILYGEKPMKRAAKLFPMFFPVRKQCFACQHFRIASAVQILPNSFTNRQLYYCPDSATEKGFPPSKYLLKRIDSLEVEQAKVQATPGQKQKKAKVGSGRK